MKGPSVTTTPKAKAGKSETMPGSEKSKNKSNNGAASTPTTPNPKKRKSSAAPSKEVVDPSQLSAYAVYNNLVPGVKSYEDTSESTRASLKKKSRKKKATEVKKREEENASTLTPAATKQTTTTTSSGPKRITPVPAPNTADATNKSKKNDVPPPATPKVTATEKQEGTPEKKKKKRKKNKNKNKNATTADTNVEMNGSPPKRSATAEPPRKVRKVDEESSKNLVPNPLANGDAKKKKNKAKKTVDEAPPAAITEKDQQTPKTKKDNKKGEKAPATPALSLGKLIKEPESDIVWKEPSSPVDLNSLLTSKVVSDSVEHGKNLFEWLIHPESVNAFMAGYWEKQSLLIKRGGIYPDYYDWILSSAKLDDVLRKNVLKFSKNIDMVNYENGERVTVSEEMSHRVRPAALWDYYTTGNSIRLLNPQTYCSPLRRLNASLQEFFGTFVGANVYLTPPGAQGFAPHYDDIEAFVLQIEGKKHWKLYKPRNANEVLPRYSSKDFGKEQETLGKPFIDVILEPGDLLYFPRGIIHQAKTVEGFHSMHITISCYQQNCWADLLKQHFAKSVDKLASSDVEFRKGLPLDYLSFMGLASSQKKDPVTISKQKDFKSKLKRLITKVGDLDAHDAADEMGKKFIWDSLPPYLTSKEKNKTVVEDGEFLNNGKVKNRVEMGPDTKIKLVRKNCVRLVVEESAVRLYHSLENALVYHEEEPNFVEVSEESVKAVEHLINSYPEYVRIEDLPFSDDDMDKKIQITSDLWERGILMTEKPLEAGEVDYDEFDDDDESLDDSQDDDDDSDSDFGEMIEGGDIDLMDTSEDDEDDGLDEDDDDDAEDDDSDEDLSKKSRIEEVDVSDDSD